MITMGAAMAGRAHEGQFVVDYDPTARTDAAGECVHLVTTANGADAKQFATMFRDVVEYWRRPSAGRARKTARL